MHAVGIHDPGHDLFIGVDIRGGDVFFGTEKLEQLSRITTGQPLQLSGRHLGRIANDATLGSSKRDVHDGAFPGHPGGKRFDFVECDVRRESQPPLTRPARDVVLDAVARENLKPPGVHENRDVNSDFPPRIAEELVEAIIQVQLLSRDVETRHHGLKRIYFTVLYSCNDRHIHYLERETPVRINRRSALP